MNEGLDFEKPIIELEKKIEALENFTSDGSIDLSGEIASLRERVDRMKKEVFSKLSPWQRTQLARHPRRPYTLDYIRLIMEGFIPLAGDRHFREDQAIVGGLAKLDGRSIVVLGHQKGRDTRENLRRNFGMAHPEGYRKALRLMQLGERFAFPIITFIDTPGAYPGIGAEERGQAIAISRNLQAMSLLGSPLIVVIIGEGGSGGALGIGVGNRILMLENAVYFVCSPEACSSILWRDSGKAAEAAKALSITAKDLKRVGVIDEIVPEPLGGAHRDYAATARMVGEAIRRSMEELKGLSREELIRDRYDKYRKIGSFLER